MGARRGPPALSSMSVFHVAPPIRLPQNLCLAVAPRISKWVTVAAPRVPLLILGKSRQVLLDTDVDSFCHPDAGPALARAAANFPEDVPSDDDSA
jgi:hypothetical protein